MKFYHCLIPALAVALLAFVGCSKKTSIDTAPLETSFKSADATIQAAADKAIAAIQAQDYSGAITELKNLAANAKLTPEQQQAVKDVIAQVEKAIADLAAKAKDQAAKTADDLKKSLPK